MTALKRLAFIACIAGCAPQSSIDLTKAWVRPPAAGLDVAAGYCDIANRGAAPIALVAVRSPAATSISIHTMSSDGDMMQMREVDRLVVPPHGTVSLAPGGAHLMLFGFNGTGNSVPLTFEFDDGTQREVAFELRSLTGAPQ